jgi:hypothetical protein
MIVLTQVVDLVDALAWPVVAIVGLCMLRKPLGSLLGDVGKRATRLSVFQVAIELATVPELAPSWKVGADDVRQLTRADVFDSATMTLFAELSSPGATDYVVVDLGEGDQWLTSRLYVFALVLRRMRGLRCMVLTATIRDETGSFIGVADTSIVRWRLAITYPWMEAAFAHAYDEVCLAMPPAGRVIISDDGALEPYQANDLVRAFLTEIQFPAQPGRPAQSAPTTSPQEWIELPGSTGAQTWERANWVTAKDLEQLLSLPPVDDTLVFHDSPDIPSDERARMLVRRSGPFVPLVTGSGRFTGLVDRQALVEGIVSSVAAPT